MTVLSLRLMAGQSPLCLRENDPGGSEHIRRFDSEVLYSALDFQPPIVACPEGRWPINFGISRCRHSRRGFRAVYAF